MPLIIDDLTEDAARALKQKTQGACGELAVKVGTPSSEGVNSQLVEEANQSCVG